MPPLTHWRIPHHAPVPGRATLGPYLRAALHLPRRPRTLDDAFRGRLADRTLTGTPTGRHALWQYLQTVPLEPGDEVLVAAYNYWVVVQLLVQRGLRPVFVDVDPQTLCMDLDDLARKVGPRSRMVLLTHMFGHPAPSADVETFCADRGLRLFEDCAHALGTEVQTETGPQSAGSFGDGALFSFGVYKNVNALGGGMLALAPSVGPPVPLPTNTGGFAEQHTRAALSLMLQPVPWTVALQPLLRRVPKLEDALDATTPPTTWAFDPASRAPFHPFMAEAVARQLRQLDAHTQIRRSITQAVYDATDGVLGIRPLRPDTHGRSNGSYLGVWVDDMDRWVDTFARRGVEAKPRQFLDCSQLPLFGDARRRCSGAAAVERHVLRLPSFPHMGASARQRLIDAIRHA